MYAFTIKYQGQFLLFDVCYMYLSEDLTCYAIKYNGQRLSVCCCMPSLMESNVKT